MNLEERKQAIDRLTNCSPLEASKIIQELELYDQENAQEVIDRITEEMKDGGLKETIVKPVFYSVVDGMLERTSMGRQAKQKGLTASRFIQECDAFSYDNNSSFDVHRENSSEVNSNDSTEKKYNRYKYVDQKKMDEYKEKAFNKNKNRKNVKDEYTKKVNIVKNDDSLDKRRNNPEDFLAETDHIVPLKQIYDETCNNFALSDTDIKAIANDNSNFALTGRKINRTKRGLTNKRFIEKQDENKSAGKPYLELDEKTKKAMAKKEDTARAKIDSGINKAVGKALVGQGSVKATQVYGTASQKAFENTKAAYQSYAIGNLILYIIKPVYYEVNDIFTNGLVEGINASSKMDALKRRFTRVKDYVFETALPFIKDNLWEFVKGFISSLVEGIINLFVGLVKKVLTVAKEGIKILIQAGKVLFGSKGKDMSTAEKGDAIIKILGAGAMAIVGTGVELLLERMAIPSPWSWLLSAFLTGLAGAFLMYALDKIDLFSVKSERRRNRICEIFDARINDTKAAAEHLDFVAIETLRRQRIGFENISNVIEVGVENDNIATINKGFYQMAEFFRVELPYSNTEEFCCYMDSNVVLKL